jgi:hypothetical protein
MFITFTFLFVGRSGQNVNLSTLLRPGWSESGTLIMVVALLRADGLYRWHLRDPPMVTEVAPTHNKSY